MKRLAVAFVLAAGTAAVAAPKYGAAGCGLGSMVLGNQKGVVQIFAATLNGISGNQLFGITSGTSNCGEDGVAMADKEKEFFADANFESLKQEMAQGKGENLEAFAGLFGCSSSAFAGTMQNNYGAVFTPGVDAAGMLHNVQGVVASDVSLQGSCSSAN